MDYADEIEEHYQQLVKDKTVQLQRTVQSTNQLTEEYRLYEGMYFPSEDGDYQEN